MTYVMSDVHGMYSLYRKMLERIGFCQWDSLYILGDICDRGEDSAKLYLDVMSRENVYCIKGNHEVMLEENLPAAFEWLRELAAPEALANADPELWALNGGEQTKRSLLRLNSREDIRRIYSFVKSLPYYRQVEINEKRFTMIHAGGYSETGHSFLAEFAPFELVWYSPEYDGVFEDWDMDTLLVGHTPTPSFTGQARIYFGAGNIIDLDCGAVFRRAGGRLGCLCLESMEEFYI